MNRTLVGDDKLTSLEQFSQLRPGQQITILAGVASNVATGEINSEVLDTHVLATEGSSFLTPEGFCVRGCESLGLVSSTGQFVLPSSLRLSEITIKFLDLMEQQKEAIYHH